MNNKDTLCQKLKVFNNQKALQTNYYDLLELFEKNDTKSLKQHLDTINEKLFMIKTIKQHEKFENLFSEYSLIYGIQIDKNLTINEIKYFVQNESFYELSSIVLELKNQFLALASYSKSWISSNNKSFKSLFDALSSFYQDG